MAHRKRGPVPIAALVMLLAACGGTASSAVRAASPASPAATAPALVKGEFVGDADGLASIAVSTNGRQVIAYLCNGTDRHVSLAEWFKGPVTGTGIDITNAHGAHLVATAGAQDVTGTVTLKDGRSAPFTARLLPDPGSDYGLFRSEETFHGVPYLGGWISSPAGFTSAIAGAGAAAGISLTAALLPAQADLEQPNHEGIAIIDERTGALIVSPPFQNPASVTVPGLGTFRLTHCLQAHC